ncbi:Hypothetical predicted protein [Mytilus galloprovincialis]|uniref:Myb/SANT-like DNA-binding domain-containing protein n=1 Tax=Mytilus galloprovincialis TaxID=29158 RepID=A0A8B6BVG6_MYTGA|nr:Hypothetical predicted protein [Mytilus galloprovincialis]
MAETESVHLQCESCKSLYSNMDEFLRHSCISAGLNSQQSTCTETGDSRDDSASSSCSPSNSPSFWSDSATKILINEVKQREVLTNKGKQTKKRMWEDISKVLAGNGFRFTWEQVQGRMKTLTTNLKKINDHNSKSGNDRKTCPYMEEMSELFQGNPVIKPKSTLGTLFQTRESNAVRILWKVVPVYQMMKLIRIKRVLKKLAHVRQSKKKKSAATEIVEFLKDYTGNQKEERASNMKERKVMHNEKMDLLREFTSNISSIFGGNVYGGNFTINVYSSNNQETITICK